MGPRYCQKPASSFSFIEHESSMLGPRGSHTKRRKEKFSSPKAKSTMATSSSFSGSNRSPRGTRQKKIRLCTDDAGFASSIRRTWSRCSAGSLSSESDGFFVKKEAKRFSILANSRRTGRKLNLKNSLVPYSTRPIDFGVESRRRWSSDGDAEYSCMLLKPPGSLFVSEEDMRRELEQKWQQQCEDVANSYMEDTIYKQESFFATIRQVSPTPSLNESMSDEPSTSCPETDVEEYQFQSDEDDEVLFVNEIDAVQTVSKHVVEDELARWLEAGMNIDDYEEARAWKAGLL